MSSRIAFQTQLASIMEVLANAAVAEICKLVDDDYAVINLQMSQCQRENKALKRKLHVLELKMARGFAERRISSLNRANRVQVSTALSDKYRNQSNDGLYGNQFNTGLWRGGRTDSTPQEAVNESDSGAGDAVLPEAETLLIKDEMFEDHQTQQRLFIRDDGITETSQTGEPGFGDVQKDDDQVSGMQHTNLEVSGSDTAVKSEFQNVKGISQEPIELHGEAKFDLNGKSSPMRDYLMQGSDNADLRQGSCAYINNATPTESQPTGSVQCSEVIEVDSAEEGEDVPAWASQVARGKSQASHVYPQFGREEHQDSRIFLPSSNSHLVSSGFAAVPSTSKIQDTDLYHNITDVSFNQQCRTRINKVPREKLFSCTYCGKVFNRPKKVIIHQRIHTGEKPFKCNTCGKFFSEAGNLRKHQKVHTGERPYSCTQCGQSFAWIRNLKNHQLKYHPDMLAAEELLSLGGVNK